VTTGPASDRAEGTDLASMVYVIDDDLQVRESLSSLLRSVDMPVRLFGSAAEFLQGALPDIPSCLVLDIRLPGVSGLDFQAQLAKSGIRMPIIFMTGHGDIPMSVRAMKAGAIDFLTKPFRDQDMLDAVYAALETERARRQSDQGLAGLRARYETLTAREKDVMARVTKGLMNKQVAGEMGLSEITVKIYRGQVMRKMAVRSLADLVRAAERLGLSSKES
jgi:FixJ family two-component response regulator